MSKPGTAPARARGRLCRKCGADEWRTNTAGYAVCNACKRRNTRRQKARRRETDGAAALYWGAKPRARAKGLPFSITIDDIRAVWPADNRCPILGIPLVRGGNGRSHGASPTLDRLNNAWGYEPANICVISHRANAAKGALRAEELEKIAAWMRQKGLD